MFLNIEKHPATSVAAIDDRGYQVTYQKLATATEQVAAHMMPRAIAFVLCENSVGALAAYIGCVHNKTVPLMLNAALDQELLNSLVQVYTPRYFWVPENKKEMFSEYTQLLSIYGYVLFETQNEIYPIHENLSLLLTTSGSTGSPKLVRYKYGNLEANAKNVSKVFGWTSQERGFCDLSMNYTMGMNGINSHLWVGATVVLVSSNIMSAEYWKTMKEQRCTNLIGVPFSYEVFFKLRLPRMKLPDMYTFAEGGGKLTDKMFVDMVDYAEANGKRFIATFGTTETSARLAFLPPEEARTHCGSIGKAIPEGKLALLDDDGNEITEMEAEGELVYEGPNVTMGYATTREELTLGDVFQGRYATGDIARRDAEGFYYIIGRKGRFLKLLGYRVSLDQSERLVKSEFGIDCACTGTDEAMVVYITDPAKCEVVAGFLADKIHLYKSLVKVRAIDDIPKNENGKTLYRLLESR